MMQRQLAARPNPTTWRSLKSKGSAGRSAERVLERAEPARVNDSDCLAAYAHLLTDGLERQPIDVVEPDGTGLIFGQFRQCKREPVVLLATTDDLARTALAECQVVDQATIIGR